MTDIEHIIFDFDGVLYLSTADSWPKKELNFELIEWIRNRKDEYSFSVLSNSGSFLNDLLENKLGIREDFDNVFNSAEIGFLKPDPAIFKYVLEKLDATPGECFFVDDLEGNVSVAQSLGFNSHLYIDNEDLFVALGKL